MRRRLPFNRERSAPRERKADPVVESELIQLVDRARHHNCQMSYAKLYEYMKQYVELFKRTVKIAGYGPDDIEQECLLALRFKAIDDFNPKRGTFRTFAILCIKRYLSSIAKANNQFKKRTMNGALSIDENRGDCGDEVYLRNLIASDEAPVDERVEKQEIDYKSQELLMIRLSEFEREVYILYRQKFHYDEIADTLMEKGIKCSRKSIDNAVQRLKSKAESVSIELGVPLKDKKKPSKKPKRG